MEKNNPRTSAHADIPEVNYPESITNPELIRALTLIDTARRIVFDNLDYLDTNDVVDRHELSDRLLCEFCDLEDDIAMLLHDRLCFDLFDDLYNDEDKSNNDSNDNC